MGLQDAKMYALAMGIALLLFNCDMSIFGKATGAGKIGDPCEEKSACESGLCLLEKMYGENTGWTDGYCTEPCDNSCQEDSTCVQLSDGGRCLATCKTHQECREGYRCNPVISACLPDCRLGFKCEQSLHCNTSGVCSTLTDAQLHATQTGDPCQWNDECLSSYCIPQRNTANGVSWKAGMCSSECGSCQTGFTCTAVGDASLCLTNCSANAPCRDGYVCNSFLKVCLPDCRLGFDCGTSLMCGQNGECVLTRDF